jgi:WD40 repeat protein
MRILYYSICTLILAILISACDIFTVSTGNIPGYNLSKPESITVLPEAIHEISGMTLIDNSSFACIEDEDGILFIYDFRKKEITRQLDFWGHGDYEGITRVKGTIYVLRSDGFLFEIANYESSKPDVSPFATGIPRSDNEGVCYDHDNNRLLITCKEYIGKGSKTKYKRVIFGFDLETKKLSEKPVYSFDLRDIGKFASENDMNIHIQSKKKTSMDENILRFHPSDIAFHPVTGEIFILSAVDYLLAVFDIQGNIRHLAMLNPTLFNQPEGIIFLQNGDMMISNEGGKGQPTLLRFNYMKR